MSKGDSGLYSGIKAHIADVAQKLPQNPEDLLSTRWQEISNGQAIPANHREFREVGTGLRIRFDKGNEGKAGFRGKDHYHIYIIPTGQVIKIAIWIKMAIQYKKGTANHIFCPKRSRANDNKRTSNKILFS